MSFTELRSILSQGSHFLGDLVWWSLADAQVERGNLESYWHDAGLPPELLPEPPTVDRSLRCAVRECAVGQHDRLIRLGKDDDNELVFAIVRESRHADGSVSFAQEGRIFLNKKTEGIADDAPGHPLVVAIHAAFTRLRTTHTPDDVRRAMLRTLNAAAAVSLRDNGGVYWIPSPHAELVRRLRDAIERIGASKVFILPVHRSAESERALGSVARGAIEQELAALQSELDQFLANPPERASTLVRRLDTFELLRAKAVLYRDVLKVHVDDIDSKLTVLSNAVEGLLSTKNAA